MTSRPVHARLLGHDFRFLAHEGLFSADRVDDGTRLLLAHLPQSAPGSVLDVGCGYGALGLPIAAAHPAARCLLVDRDLLAVAHSARNAASHGLGNVRAVGSLGYRDLGNETFDWIVCNVPARIGRAAIEYLLGGGASRLNAGGELRVVVINELGPVVESVAAGRGWDVRLAAAGERHKVYAQRPAQVSIDDHEELYRLDAVRVGAEAFDRPHDVNEDAGHLREGVPLLLDCLPRTPGRTLTWRAGYGPVPLLLAQRGARVVAADRDLLQLAFARRNATAHGLAIDPLPRPDFGAPERFDLVVGELHASAGIETLGLELAASKVRLDKGGQALWLGLAKTLKALAGPLGATRGTTVATRGAYSVVRLGAG